MGVLLPRMARYCAFSTSSSLHLSLPFERWSRSLQSSEYAFLLALTVFNCKPQNWLAFLPLPIEELIYGPELTSLIANKDALSHIIVLPVSFKFQIWPFWKMKGFSEFCPKFPKKFRHLTHRSKPAAKPSDGRVFRYFRDQPLLVFNTFKKMYIFHLRMALVILLMYYSFGIVGIECFSGLKLKNCCQ